MRRYKHRHTRSHNFDNCFDFDADIEGQRSHSDGTACVPPTVAEDLNKKVRTAVDDLRVIGKVRCGIHHPEHAPDTNDLVEAPEFLPHHREEHQTDEPCVLVGFVKG